MAASRILKSTTLNLAGKKRLSAAPAKPSATSSASGVSAKAKILSQEDGHVVIQVICSCGQEIQLRCATDESAG
jgi:hypothetical protein